LVVFWKQIAMREVMQPRPKMMNPQPAPSRLRREGFLETLVLGLALSVSALLVVPAILGGKNLPAQTQAPQSTNPAQQQKPATAHAEDSLIKRHRTLHTYSGLVPFAQPSAEMHGAEAPKIPPLSLELAESESLQRLFVNMNGSRACKCDTTLLCFSSQGLPEMHGPFPDPARF
jgi:hypothetical protein